MPGELITTTLTAPVLKPDAIDLPKKDGTPVRLTVSVQSEIFEIPRTAKPGRRKSSSSTMASFTMLARKKSTSTRKAEQELDIKCSRAKGERARPGAIRDVQLTWPGRSTTTQDGIGRDLMNTLPLGHHIQGRFWRFERRPCQWRWHDHEEKSDDAETANGGFGGARY